MSGPYLCSALSGPAHELDTLVQVVRHGRGRAYLSDGLSSHVSNARYLCIRTREAPSLTAIAIFVVAALKPRSWGLQVSDTRFLGRRAVRMAGWILRKRGTSRVAVRDTSSIGLGELIWPVPVQMTSFQDEGYQHGYLTAWREDEGGRGQPGYVNQE